MKLDVAAIRYAFRPKVLIFATVLTLLVFGFDMADTFLIEAWKISQRSSEVFGIDITPGIRYWEVLKSAGYDVWRSLFIHTTVVFLPAVTLCALIKKLVTNETRVGWKRLSIVLPALFAGIWGLFLSFGTKRFRLDFVIVDCLLLACITLIIVWTIKWVVLGFSGQKTEN